MRSSSISKLGRSGSPRPQASTYGRVRNRLSTRGLLAAGALAGIVFVGAFLIEGTTRPGYEPLRHPVNCSGSMWMTSGNLR